MKSGTSVVQSSEQARLLPLEYGKFKFSLRTHDTYVKESVNALPKVVSFLRLLQFPPAGWVGISPYNWD